MPCHVPAHAITFCFGDPSPRAAALSAPGAEQKSPEAEEPNNHLCRIDGQARGGAWAHLALREASPADVPQSLGEWPDCALRQCSIHACVYAHARDCPSVSTV